MVTRLFQLSVSTFTDLLLLMILILHYLKDPKLRELWHMPYGQCRTHIINRSSCYQLVPLVPRQRSDMTSAIHAAQALTTRSLTSMEDLLP